MPTDPEHGRLPPAAGEDQRPAEHPGAPAVVLALIAACTVIEIVLQLADYGILDMFRARRNALDYGGFWPGLLWGGTPNYAVQPGLMFFTYSFLHGGLVHLLMNMVTLYSLGIFVVERIGSIRFLEIYVASVLGGAIAYGLLSDSFSPMVGASGALFGLAGTIVAWEYVDARAAGAGPGRALRMAGFLILLNIVLWWLYSGRLAWQTHLGGFLTGFLLGIAFTGRGGNED